MIKLHITWTWLKESFTVLFSWYLILAICLGSWDIFLTVDNLIGKKDIVKMSLSNYKGFKPTGW